MRLNKLIYIIISFLTFCCQPMMAQFNGTGYYRFRNVGNENDYISIANDKFSYQFLFGGSPDTHFNNKPQVCGGLSNLADNTNTVKPVVISGAELFLKNDIQLVEDPDGTDPSTILYLNKINGSKYNIIGQGTSLLTLTTGIYEASVRLIFKDISTTISASNGNYTASVIIQASDVENISYSSLKFAFGKSLFLSQAKLGTYYFTDNAGTFSINTSNNSNNAKWAIEKVERLNVKPTVEYKGKYYTTMYVPFAYTLAGDVLNAYVVTSINSHGTLEKNAIASTGETVPAGTPVVLECASNDVTECYLELATTPPLYSGLNIVDGFGTTTNHYESQYAPAASTASNYTGTNLLKGVYFMNTDESYSYQYSREGTNKSDNLDLSNTTPYNNQTMYVLGVGSQSGRLGFFRNANNVMKANKAWLEIPAANANEVYTLDFDEQVQKGGNDE